jgi:hypothetical protein
MVEGGCRFAAVCPVTRPVSLSTLVYEAGPVRGAQRGERKEGITRRSHSLTFPGAWRKRIAGQQVQHGSRQDDQGIGEDDDVQAKVEIDKDDWIEEHDGRDRCELSVIVRRTQPPTRVPETLSM